MNKEKGTAAYYKSLRKNPFLKFIRYLKNIIGNIQEELEVAVDRGNLEKVKELLAIGADPNARFGFNKTTFLHRARSAEVVRELLSHGAEVNARDVYLCTPLYYSVTKESPAVVRELLAHGADVNAADENGDTALSLALNDYPKLEVIRELLDHGANLSKRDVDRYLLCYFTRSCSAIKTIQLPVAKVLVKFTLLEHFKDDYKSIVDLEPFSKCLSYEELACYRDECAREIVQMMKHKINNDFSIYDYIINKPRNIKPYSGKPIGEEVSAKYPIYHDVILCNVKSCLERSELLEKFTSLEISVTSKGKEVVLSYDCLCVIAEFLSNEDLTNCTAPLVSNFEQSNFPENILKIGKQCEEIDLYGAKCTIF